jgi:molybdopterin synthase catalytic subunit
MRVRVQQEPLDVAGALDGFAAGRLDAGAVVTFTGLCRGDDEGRRLAALTLEAYPEMAEAELARLVAEAEARWPLIDVAVVHRYGRIEPGEAIVLVACASAHRRAAFEAAEFLMDYLKTRAPFWKSEETSGGERRWIEAKAEDDAAAGRW